MTNSAEASHLRKQKTSFSKKLLKFTIATLILIFIGLAFLWVYLMDYENNIPSGKAEEIAVAYETANPKALQKYFPDLPKIFLEEGVLEEYLDSTGNTESIFYYQDNKDNDNPVYLIQRGREKLATLSLAKTDKKSLFGFPKYSIVSAKQEPLKTYTIIAPPGDEVLLNGEPIDQGYLVTSHPALSCFSPGEAHYITQDFYVINDFNMVKDLSGQDLIAEVVEDNNNEITYHLYKEPSEEDRKELEDFVTIYAKTYTNFAAAEKVPIGPVLQMTEKDSPWYNSLKNYSNYWGVTFVKSSYENVEIKDFRQYSPNDYSCQFSLDYVVTSKYRKEKTYHFNFQVYVSRIDGKMKVKNMEAIVKNKQTENDQVKNEADKNLENSQIKNVKNENGKV